MHTIQLLTDGIVDYAGLFPPASLSMDHAVGNFAEYLDGPDARMLGRFVVPATRLTEFGNALQRVSQKRSSHEPWKLSVILGSTPSDEIKSILKFNCEHWAGSELGHCIIDSVEFKAASASDIQSVGSELPKFFRAFAEVSAPDDSMLNAISGAGFSAKIRTGGITQDAFPAAKQIASFMIACRTHGIAFKATAGLHHALCGDYALTYDLQSGRAPMFGFLNVFIASAFVFAGCTAENAVRLLNESNPDAFKFDDARLMWGQESVSAQQVRECRARFATSFGSCSFIEPVGELADLANHQEKVGA